MHSATYAHCAAHSWTAPAVHPRTVRAGREWTRRYLSGQHLPGPVVDDAVLIVSELLTNVLYHAPGDAELTLLIEQNLLTITCADRDRAAFEPGSLDPGSTLGRRLILVDAVAYACFVRRRVGGGKRIIALVELGAG